MNNFKISDSVLDYSSETIKIRRFLHQHPELGFQEYKTSELISQKLSEYGYEVSKVAGTGVVGLLNHTDGKTIAVRADMDALPLKELNEAEYHSLYDGKMHACGHDGHVAIALATARNIVNLKDKINGNVKFIFQPAEESPGGALPMINEGVLENPSVDAIFGLHLWNSLPLGTVGLNHGPLMASADEFSIVIKGKGGHGAQPHETVDAIVISSHIITALQTIVSRNVNPLDTAVVSVGKISGGSNFNIIAETVRMSGTVRTFNTDLSILIEKRIENLVKNITSSFNAEYEFVYNRIYPPTVNHSAMIPLVKNAALPVVGADMIIEDSRTMAAEDMSYFLQKVPGCFFLLGSANKEKGFDKPNHNPYFDFDETALSVGTQIMTNIILKYFEAE